MENVSQSPLEFYYLHSADCPSVINLSNSLVLPIPEGPLNTRCDLLLSPHFKDVNCSMNTNVSAWRPARNIISP